MLKCKRNETKGILTYVFITHRLLTSIERMKQKITSRSVVKNKNRIDVSYESIRFLCFHFVSFLTFNS